MESAAALRSLYCTMSATPYVQPLLEKPGGVPMHNASLNKSSFTQCLTGSGRLIAFHVNRTRTYLPCFKASGTTAETIVNAASSSQEPLEKKNLQIATFPNGFEALVLEVCDETEVAELKLKIGDFEMHMKRNIGVIKAPPPTIPPSTPPPVASKPVTAPAPATPTSPPKSSSETTNPFKNISLAKSSKLAALEASGSNTYVLISSPTVGSFRRGKTVKGKRQPPICKEGDEIKEGQVIGFLDQFGSELPVKSDVTGEVLKLLYDDGEAVGYGDPLVAVLPSFQGIR